MSPSIPAYVCAYLRTRIHMYTYNCNYDHRYDHEYSYNYDHEYNYNYSESADFNGGKDFERIDYYYLNCWIFGKIRHGAGRYFECSECSRGCDCCCSDPC